MTQENAPAKLSAIAQSDHAALILVVDDTEGVRSLYRMILMHAGYRVVEAETPERAQELVREGLPFDLVVTDYLMPGMTGAELAAWCLSVKPAMPVVLFSAHPTYVELALQAVPTLHCCTRPQNAADVLSMVRSALRRNPPPAI